jgi:hypothetical protein
MTLGYLACAGLGWAILRTGIAARRTGWFAIIFGLSAGGVVGFVIPLMVHIPLIITGVSLLRLRNKGENEHLPGG